MECGVAERIGGDLGNHLKREVAYGEKYRPDRERLVAHRLPIRVRVVYLSRWVSAACALKHKMAAA